MVVGWRRRVEFDITVQPFTLGQRRRLAHEITIYIGGDDRIGPTGAGSETTNDGAGTAADFENRMSWSKIQFMEQLIDDTHIARLRSGFEMGDHAEMSAAQGNDAESFR